METSRRKRYSYWLSAFYLLFIFRVFAQLIQAVWPLEFLPPFESWQSGAMPYSLLLLSQVSIIAILSYVLYGFLSEKIECKPKLGLVCLIVGFAYFLLMVFRLVAGFSFASEHPWLGAHIPAIFHMVLAAFLLCVGLFHCDYSEKIVAIAGYPFIIMSALLFHLLALRNGMGLLLATYIPVTVAALVILYLEYTNPYRKQWQPNMKNIKADAAYMLLVQMLLPRFLGFILLLSVLNLWETEANFPWPHSWPIVSQVILMLLSADFLRYWLHRLSHNWSPLWRLHAVHHSPHNLYWLNVNRFHPIEKAIQFLFDAMPFVLMGVAENVISMYFVFYAVNGFIQHCNIDFRLGFLNYIISGPQLHRWHHSVVIQESNRNYGNNLIIWDLLFGTWFLPKKREVQSLGLLNREYPQDFISQIKSPFLKGLDKNLP